MGSSSAVLVLVCLLLNGRAGKAGGSSVKLSIKRKGCWISVPGTICSFEEDDEDEDDDEDKDDDDDPPRIPGEVLFQNLPLNLNTAVNTILVICPRPSRWFLHVIAKLMCPILL